MVLFCSCFSSTFASDFSAFHFVTMAFSPFIVYNTEATEAMYQAVVDESHCCLLRHQIIMNKQGSFLPLNVVDGHCKLHINRFLYLCYSMPNVSFCILQFYTSSMLFIYHKAATHMFSSPIFLV